MSAPFVALDIAHIRPGAANKSLTRGVRFAQPWNSGSSGHSRRCRTAARCRIGGQKQRGVLALLLLHANEVVSTDRLIDEVWGDAAAEERRCVAPELHLAPASVVGREAIETRPPGLPAERRGRRVDALPVRAGARGGATRSTRPSVRRRCARRSRSGAARRSPTSSSRRSRGTEVARLDELRLAALEERIDAELALGRHDAILGEIEALATRHPMRERLRRQQMLALYRAGRQRDALRVYQEARLELVEEFGLEPSEELRALERMIIAHDPALQPRRGDPRALARRPQAQRRRRAARDRRPRTARAARRGAAARARRGRRDRRTPRRRACGSSLAEEIVAVFGAPEAHDDDALRALRAVDERLEPRCRERFVRSAPRSSGSQGGDRARGDAEACSHSAAAGDLLLGPEALRRCPGGGRRRAARVAVPGYRVLRFDPGAESFVRHLDAPIVGRGAELERLETVLAEVASGAPLRRRVVLVGEPGIGKTRLANAFVSRSGSAAAHGRGAVPRLR